MKKLAMTTIAAALAGLMAIPTPVSAQSASFNITFGQQDRFISERCRVNPNWRGCSDWRRNHHRWGHEDYRRWYRWNQPKLGNVAAGLFGLTVGAAIASSIANSRSSSSFDAHVARCEAKYRSYKAETDMFLGYDGNYHRCRL